MKILIVDDYIPLAESFAESLRQIGHTVVLAANGVDGFMRFHQEAPDIVLTDWNMPKMDGPTMVAEILRHNPSAKIIMMSGDSSNKPPAGIKILYKGKISRRDLLVAFDEVISA